MQQSAPQGHFKLLMTLLGATIGIPAGSAVVFRGWAFQHPLLGAALVVVYELILLIVAVMAGLVKEVWGRQRPLLVEWLNLRVVWMLSRYYKRYCQQLVYWYRDIDARGTGIQGPFTLQVEESFVELTLVPTPPNQASANPTPLLPEALREGRHSIWEYLTARRSSRHLVILGAPGMGKTTLLQHLTLTLANPKQRRKVSFPPKLPILLFLREHAQAIAATPDLSLVELLENQFKKRRHAAPPGWFEHHLQRGHCLVLLDGLDEVADPEAREVVVQWVGAQMRTYGRNRFLLTSRPYGYQENSLNGVDVLEVCSFSRKQVAQFIRAWYLATEIKSARLDDAGVRQKAADEAENLLQRLSLTPALFDLAVNPLLLTMLTTVHRYQSALPGARADLYAKVCEVFLGRRQEAKALPLELKPDQIQSVLQPLAYYLMCSGQQAIQGEEIEQVIANALALVHPHLSVPAFLKLVENSGGLLLEAESGFYEFAHLTFQEYLAAVHIVKEHGLEQEVLRHVADEWWHETIRLAAAQTDATPIIEACLAAQPRSARVLELALACEEEAQKVQPAIRARIQEVLEQGIEDSNLEQGRMVAEILLNRRLHRHLVPLDERRSATTSLITCAEYQLFVDTTCTNTEHHQPDHWTTARFPAGQGRSPVLGVRPDDAQLFGIWLNHRALDNWNYRLPAAGELGHAHVGQLLRTELADGRGYWVDGGQGFEQATAPTTRHALTWEMVDEQLAHDLSQARDRARAMASHSDPNHIWTHKSDLDVVYGLAYDLARALTLDLTLDYHLVHSILHARPLPRPFAHAHFRQFFFAKELALSLPRSQDLAQSLSITLNRDLSRTFAPGLAIALLRALKCSTWAEAMQVLRWLIRLAALALAALLFSELEYSTQRRRKNARHSKRGRAIRGQRRKLRRFWGSMPRRMQVEVRQAAEAYLDLYLNFVLLEARIEGKLQPFEGLVIVKEAVMK